MALYHDERGERDAPSWRTRPPEAIAEGTPWEWCRPKAVRIIFGVVRVGYRLLDALGQLLRIDDHLLLHHGAHRVEGDDEVAGVLDVDQQLRAPARRHLAHRADLFVGALREHVKADLDHRKLAAHGRQLGRCAPSRATRRKTWHKERSPACWDPRRTARCG